MTRQKIFDGHDPVLYAMTHPDCEIWGKLPIAWRGRGLVPGFNASHFYQDATQTHHLHRGCRRLDYDWNIVRVCSWVHTWAHVNIDNENAVRIIAINSKMRNGTWNGDEAFAVTGIDLVGMLCGWKPPKRLAWIVEDLEDVTSGHRPRERR